MPQDTKTAYCNNCKKPVTFHYQPVNHLVQLIATLFTVGMWLPIWITMTFMRTRLCDECNNPIWKN